MENRSIKAQLSEYEQKRIEGISISSAEYIEESWKDDSNEINKYNKCRVTIETKIFKDTPYESEYGVFSMELRFPINYPNFPPKLYTETKTYHPCISIKEGEVKLQILDQHYWSPTTKIYDILKATKELFFNPLPEKLGYEEGLKKQYNESPIKNNLTFDEFVAKLHQFRKPINHNQYYFNSLEAAKTYVNDREKFNQTAKEWVEKYAV